MLYLRSLIGFFQLAEVLVSDWKTRFSRVFVPAIFTAQRQRSSMTNFDLRCRWPQGHVGSGCSRRRHEMAKFIVGRCRMRERRNCSGESV